MTFRGFLDKLLIWGLESFGKYYSSYRGYVVDRNDPEGVGRIKVKVPTITGDSTHPKWAYPKNNYSGNNYGLQVLPSKGDLVWVEFEAGNANFPMWTHGHFGKDERPEEFASNNIYGFKSPKGQVVVIDDDNEIIIINRGDNEGLVKVIELTEQINKVEDKVNDILTHYKAHFVIDPISGTAGPLMSAPPAPINIINTQQSQIENKKVKH